MIKHLLTICSFLLLVSSCKKDDNDDPSAITKENLSGSYVFVSAKGKVGLIEQDITNNETFIPACIKDDVITLRPNLTFSSQDAGVACNQNGIFPDSGTWSLPNTNTIVLEDETFTILSFDGRNLQLGNKADIPMFGQVDVILNFRKQ